MADTKATEFHYFFSNSIDWVVDENFARGVHRLDQQNQHNGNFRCEHFAAYKVPTDIKAHYEIDEYAPQVEGTVKIGRFEHSPQRAKRRRRS